MRIAPNDPSVFDWGIEFVKKTADDDATRDYSEDVYWRLDALIPFQPLERMADARNTHRDLATRLAQAPQEVATVPLLIHVCDRLIDLDKFPLVLQGDLVQSIRGESVAMAIELGGVSVDDWNEVENHLRQAEDAVLRALWDDVHRRWDKWRDDAQRFKTNIDMYAPPRSPVESGLYDRRYEGVITDGLHLRSEMVPLADQLGRDERDTIVNLDREIDILASAREWRYNQYVLYVSKNVANETKGIALDRLRRLAIIETDRLIPYVGQQWEAAWNTAFDSLKTDNEKSQAVKLRITRGRHINE
jgi:hypothetical protein